MKAIKNCEVPFLSQRLTALMEMVTPGLRLADIGTDHALLPVRLLMDGKIPFAYCCDVRPGPLERAEDHLKQYGVQQQAETRLSDGLSALEPGEAESVLIAGMGGELIVRILKECDSRKDRSGGTFYGTVKEWILSPHTEWGAVRRYLRLSGRRIAGERLVREDGKYYLILRAVPGETEKTYREAERKGLGTAAADCFGPLLCASGDALLLSYLGESLRKNDMIRRKLLKEEETSGMKTLSAERRLVELYAEAEVIRNALRTARNAAAQNAAAQNAVTEGKEERREGE